MKEMSEMIKEANKNKRPKMNWIMAIVLTILAIYAISMIGLLVFGFLTSLRSGEHYSIKIIDWPRIVYYPDGSMNLYSKENLFGMNYVRAALLFREMKTGNYSYYSIFGEINQATNSKQVTFSFAIFNTLIYAIVGSAVYAFVCMTVGYLCSKYRYRFSKFLIGLNLVVMTIPIVGSQPAMIDFMQKSALYDSYLGMILQKFAFTGMYFFVFVAFFNGIADSYIEAAEIDGASQMGCYLRIMVPLAIKMYGTIFMLQFIALWNDYQTPLLYFPTKYTLSFAVYRVAFNTSQGETYKGPEWTGVPQKIASCYLLALPMILIFIVFNKKIIGDISIGGLKE